MSTEEIINSHEFDDLGGFFEKHKEQEEETYKRIEKSKIYGLGEYTGKIKLEGVGRDVEIVTNSNGGKQSKTPMALHLVDARYLKDWAVIRQHYLESYYNNKEDMISPEDIYINDCYKAIEFIADFMMDGRNDHLRHAITRLETDSFQQIIRIAKVLQIGADRYEANNWRLIPQESHVNHALIHLVAHLMGDEQDDHIDHALCRLMMAMSTEKSEGFDYNKYVSKIKLNLDIPPHISFDVDNSKPTCSYKYDCDYKEDNK